MEQRSPLDIGLFQAACKMQNLPQRIGNYALEREIGRGGASEVWLARHIHLEKRQVAIKILMSHDNETIQRFMREANLASRLTHPCIVQVYDYGQYDRLSCTILEYIPGVSLRQLLERQQNLSLADAINIFRQIADALDYAHRVGVIHRDVSPGNILIEQSSRRRALLTDFGIARDPAQSITVTSAIMGTPGFLSPEHIKSATAVTHLSDIYSLGIVLYNMLSGELPWDEPPDLADRSFKAQPPIPLRQRGIKGLPIDVDRVIQTMLAVDPAKRYSSARSAVDELEHILERHQLQTQMASQQATPLTITGHSTYESHGLVSDMVEPALGADLVREPIERARQRAEELRQETTITRLLDEWSSQVWLRRRMLGRLARLHKVQSRNVYFYHLKVLYEQRELPELRETPDYKAAAFTPRPEMDRWQVTLPQADEFNDEPGEEVNIPGSTRVIACPKCDGKGLTVCPRCQGRQRITVVREIEASSAYAQAKRDPSQQGQQRSSMPQTAQQLDANDSVEGSGKPKKRRTEKVLVPCPDCDGRGGFVCERCDGVGRLTQRKAFHWRRTAQVREARDDLPNLDEAWLQRTCKAEQIYCERADNGFRTEWLLIPILGDLVAEAQSATSETSRVALSEVTISFIPLSDIVFDLGDYDEAEADERGLYRLSIYGFENVIPPDWRFLNWERVIFLLITAFLTILVVIFGIFALMG